MRLNSEQVASFPEYAQASTGGPTFPAYPVINEPAGQTVPNARLQFGDSIIDKWGNVFCYVRAAEALTVGQVVKLAVGGVGDVPAVGTISASTTAKRIFSNITTTLNERSLGSFLASPGTVAGVGTPFLKPIKGQVAIGANTTFDISKTQTLIGIGQYDGDALAAVPATSDALVVIRPYNVGVCVAASSGVDVPVGVAMGTVSAAGGTLVQIQGLGSVMGVNTTAALTLGGLAIAAASGAVSGPTTTPTAFEIAATVGRAQVAWNSTIHLIPVQIQLIHKM